MQILRHGNELVSCPFDKCAAHLQDVYRSCRSRSHTAEAPSSQAAATVSTSEQTPQTQACSTHAVTPRSGAFSGLLSRRVPICHDGTATNSEPEANKRSGFHGCF